VEYKVVSFNSEYCEGCSWCSDYCGQSSYNTDFPLWT
jgi:Pyruvate/2-oxoacid:ferredoxin oxidoreductase delta subunit